MSAANAVGVARPLLANADTMSEDLQREYELRFARTAAYRRHVQC